MNKLWCGLLFTLTTSCVAESTFQAQELNSSMIQDEIRHHQITCVELTNTYLDRIKKYNLSFKGDISVNALTEINPYVLEEARALDQTFEKTHVLAGPLHCVPVVIKDNINSSDMSTTVGSLALLGNQPIYDAVLVDHLRRAGAVILAKGTMDEFASGMYGISSRSGRTGNAYDPSQNPGGSSSGPAVAVAENFSVLGIGTDNSGSVRIPAAFNGLIGLRPSMGLISQQGIFPMGNLDGTAGPIVHTVEDLAKVLEVIAEPPHAQTYTHFLKKEGLQGKRIGIVHQVANIDVYQDMPENIHQLIQQTLHTMHRAGATLIDPVNLPDFNSDRTFNNAGEIEAVNQYLAAFPAVRQNFRDICLSDRTRTFGSIKECLQFMKKIPKASSPQYQQVLSMFKKNKTYVEQIMKAQNLDALFIPISTSGSATYDALRVNTWRAPISSNTGLPALEMSIGLDTTNQLPVGIEIIGKQFDEGRLIEMAYAYEQVIPLHLHPPLPIENVVLEKADIPSLNHLFTLIGHASYEEMLKDAPRNQKDKAEIITPFKFQATVDAQIYRYICPLILWCPLFNN